MIRVRINGVDDLKRLTKSTGEFCDCCGEFYLISSLAKAEGIAYVMDNGTVLFIGVCICRKCKEKEE